MFLHGDGVVSTAFKSEIVRNNHALALVNLANTSDDIADWHTIL
jgi:hypothetical protein